MEMWRRWVCRGAVLRMGMGMGRRMLVGVWKRREVCMRGDRGGLGGGARGLWRFDRMDLLFLLISFFIFRC